MVTVYYADVKAWGKVSCLLVAGSLSYSRSFLKIVKHCKSIHYGNVAWFPLSNSDCRNSKCDIKKKKKNNSDLSLDTDS